MPAVYTVSQGRNQKMTFSGSEDSLSVTWHQDYYVDVSGVAATAVNSYDVISASGLPIVNRSIYYDGTKIIPFVVCRDKEAEQMREKLSRWKVATKWTSPKKSNNQEDDNAPISPPTNLDDITPRVVSRLGEVEKVLYYDKDGKVCYLTPSKSFWSDPVIERIPTLTLEITQYEASITYEQMLERKFKVNKSTYRSKPRYSWLIEDVQAVEVSIQLAGGPTTAAQVTYTVSLSPHLNRWKEERALFDTHYLDGGDRKPFVELLDYGVGYITNLGAKRSSQTGEPDYILYETFSDINFSDFLQV